MRTERQKMLAGELYDAFDSELVQARARARDLCQDLNITRERDQIYAATHPLAAPLRRSQEFGKPVSIGADVWVGGGAIICPGVTIGSKTVIGAGSVVTNDIPDGVLAAGNPCRVIREI